MVITASACNISHMIMSPLVVPIATYSTGLDEGALRYRNVF